MRIEDLSIEEKKALLVRALKRRGQHQAFAPVSQAQKRLWFLEQLAPGSAIYNVGKAVRILGRISIPTVERVLNEIIRRHETLRTTFRLEGDDPVQVISQPSPFNLSIQHIADNTVEEAEKQITTLIVNEIQRPFNLSAGPLLRIALFRISEEDHVAVVAMHHIISDGWSTGIFIKELGLLYAAYSHGMPSPLPEPAIQYKDLALRETQNSTAGRLNELICFWQQHLKDAPHIISLPTDRPRNNVMTFAGKKKAFAMSIELTRSLKELAAGAGVTLYMALLAIFSTLLHRLTEEDEFLVGTPVAGRDRPETQGLIGFLVNTVVLRMNLAHNPTFLDLCARVRDEALSCFEHQDLPFDKLVEAIRPERNLGMNPLIQVMVALHNMPLPSPSYPGISITPLDIHSGISPLDLAIEFYDGPSGINGGIEYKTSLFDDSTIERMASQFLGIAASVVARPDVRLSDLSLLTEAERERLLVEWNATQIADQSTTPVHRLIEEQAARTPDDVALLHKAEEVSYRELNDRANNLARHLMQLGAGAEQPIAVCMERSVASIVSMLGIFKAGAVYLPLNPSSPIKRNTAIMADAGAAILLTSTTLAENVFCR